MLDINEEGEMGELPPPGIFPPYSNLILYIDRVSKKKKIH